MGEQLMLSEMRIGHECALAGVILGQESNEIFRLLSNGLDAQNHRGEEAAGMAWSDGGRIFGEKNLGLRQAALSDSFMSSLPPISVAIGHTRYSTAGKPNRLNAQPFVFEEQRFAIAHNGNVHWNIPPGPGEPTSDTYGIGKQIARGAGSITENMIQTLPQLNGAYSFLFMTPGGLFAARDPWGFRPLIGGKLDNGVNGYVVGSESIGPNSMHAHNLENIPRGTLIQVHPDGYEVIWQDQRVNEVPQSGCTFENAYFADAASRIDVSIQGERTNHELRVELGRRLYQRAGPNGDFVTPIPNSGRSYAEGVSLESGIPLVQAIHTNRHAGRNFIKPQTPEERIEAAFKKYLFIPELIRGKKLIIVDDSMVRGSTMSGLILNLFQLGASDIDVLIGVPPIKHPCYWGIDFQNPNSLIYNMLMKNENSVSFEDKLSSWLVAGDKTLSAHLRIFFQELDDYHSIMGEGCFHCVSGIIPGGALTDQGMTKERFD